MTWHLIDDPDNQPPKDGTKFDVWADGRRVTGVRWVKPTNRGILEPSAPETCCVLDFRRDEYDTSKEECVWCPVHNVTHWAPLPPPPDTQEIE